MISPAAETYAKALFDLAFEAGGGEESLQEFFRLAEVLSEPEFFRFFLSPVLPLGERQKVLASALKSASPMLENFLSLLLEKKRFSLLPEIRRAGQGLLDKRNNVLRGEIRSAAPLSPEEKSLAAAEAGRFLNKKLELEEKQDESLIDGFSIKVGGWRIDNSARFHLKKFQDLKIGLTGG